MIELLNNVPNINALTAAEVHEYLTTAEPKKQPQTHYTLLGLQNKLGVDRVVGWKFAIRTAANAVRESNPLQAEKLDTLLESLLVGNGPDFSGQEVSESLLTLVAAGIFTTDDYSDLDSLGWDYRTPWQRYSDKAPPTVQEVTDWMLRRTNLDLLQTRAAEAAARLRAGKLTTLDEVVEFINTGEVE